MKLQELFGQESKWTRGALARDKDGKTVEPTSETAVCWCLGGGIIKCCDNPEVRRRIRVYTGIHGITVWNDCFASFERLTQILKALDL